MRYSRRKDNRRRSQKRPDSLPREPIALTVEKAGRRGDGVALWQGKPVYVPMALPGEEITVRLEGKKADGFAGRLHELVTASPDRVDAPCPHFGPCGGCIAQHMSQESYITWKTEGLRHALACAGFDPADLPLKPMRRIAPGSRRRAGFVVIGGEKRVFAGFHERESNQVVDISVCQLLMPQLCSLPHDLRELMTGHLAPGEWAKADVNLLDHGLDILLTLDKAPDLAFREALASFATELDLCRLSLRIADAGYIEPVAERRDAVISFGGVQAPVPPGAFLQASTEGELLMVNMALDLAEALRRAGGLGHACDLFAGCGSFTLPLSEIVPVLAIESDPSAVSALDATANMLRHDPSRKGIGGAIHVEKRDLFRNPLEGPELKGIDLMVMDPPRAGARAQSAAIAVSDIPAVVAVSCNPSTFARDLRLLVDGGYHLESLQPVDQFPWTHHLEVVGILKRS